MESAHSTTFQWSSKIEEDRRFGSGLILLIALFGEDMALLDPKAEESLLPGCGVQNCLVGLLSQELVLLGELGEAHFLLNEWMRALSIHLNWSLIASHGWKDWLQG